MLNDPCRILLVEDEAEDANLIKTMLGDVYSSFFERGFDIIRVETLAEAKKAIFAQNKFDVILLDLVLPDSRYVNSLQELQNLTTYIPIIVMTSLEDEVVAVRSLELGASGYLPKAALESLDSNLLLYAIRNAIERKQQLAELEKSQNLQKDKELDILERLLSDASNFGRTNTDSLSQRMPDIFREIEGRYSQLLDRFVQEKIYRIAQETPEQANILVEQLGYLQATPNDIIQIHTNVLKNKQNSATKNNKVFMVEGRYLLLKLMSKLAAYYRRYYIGLNKINTAQDLYKA